MTAAVSLCLLWITIGMEGQLRNTTDISPESAAPEDPSRR